MSSQELQELRRSLDEEIQKITDKMPWYKQAWIYALITGAVVLATAACGVITIGTIGAGLIPCALAMLALITLLIGILTEHIAADEEANALERKAEQMEELVAELESG
jgi:hypothetical protein